MELNISEKKMKFLLMLRVNLWRALRKKKFHSILQVYLQKSEQLWKEQTALHSLQFHFKQFGSTFNLLFKLSSITIKVGSRMKVSNFRRLRMQKTQRLLLNLKQKQMQQIKKGRRKKLRHKLRQMQKLKQQRYRKRRQRMPLQKQKLLQQLHETN